MGVRKVRWAHPKTGESLVQPCLPGTPCPDEEGASGADGDDAGSGGPGAVSRKRMTRGAWKAAEREIAARLGGVRVPITGRGRGDAPDIAHATFSIEVKRRARQNQTLKGAMAQAIASIRGDQIPLVVLHEAGSLHDNDYCVMRLKDFVNLVKREE